MKSRGLREKKKKPTGIKEISMFKYPAKHPGDVSQDK